jgi:fatty acid desaturase
MKQPWLNNAKTDSVFILLPQFLVLTIVFCFQGFLQEAEENHSFFTWLILIVFMTWHTYMQQCSRPIFRKKSFRTGENYWFTCLLFVSCSGLSFSYLEQKFSGRSWLMLQFFILSGSNMVL